MMKAMVLENYNQPLVEKSVPIPEIGSEDLLIKIKACGVCGTDLKISAGWINTVQVPLILGHEPMGEIVKVGTEVKDFKPGDRVIIASYQTCGNCKFCLSGRQTLCLNLKGRTGFEMDGGFAEYMKIPAFNAVKIPVNIGDNEASIISCGLATPYHGLITRARVTPADNVVIMGVGGLGLHGVQVAKLCGAKVIAVDIKDENLKMAQEFGADITLKFDKDSFVSTIKEITKTGASVIFETVGQPVTIEESLKALEPGGKLVQAGYYPGKAYAVDSLQVVLNELEIIGVRCINKEELRQLVNLVADGRIKPIVTGEFKLDEINSVLDKLRQGKLIGRVVVKP